MSDLRFNKIAGAVLATGLFVLGLQQLGDIVFSSSPPAKPGYAIQVAEESSGESAPAADLPPDWGVALPAANVQAGEEQSKKCASCHTFTKGGPDGTGPNNWGVIGRKPGSKPGFSYSSGMVDFGNKIGAWDYDHLYDFLKSPQAYIQGTKMTFVGLKKPEDRINLIAWLRQQSDSPAPIPPPKPKAAAPAESSAPAASSAPAESSAPAKS